MSFHSTATLRHHNKPLRIISKHRFTHVLPPVPSFCSKHNWKFCDLRSTEALTQAPVCYVIQMQVRKQNGISFCSTNWDSRIWNLQAFTWLLCMKRQMGEDRKEYSHGNKVANIPVTGKPGLLWSLNAAFYRKFALLGYMNEMRRTLQAKFLHHIAGLSLNMLVTKFVMLNFIWALVRKVILCGVFPGHWDNNEKRSETFNSYSFFTLRLAKCGYLSVLITFYGEVSMLCKYSWYTTYFFKKIMW